MVEFELGNQAPLEFGIELGSGTKVLETEYLSLERLGNYLYKATFDNVPDYKPINNINVGGCTSFVRDGKLYRNFDWMYNNCPTFIVRTKEFEGIASITTLVDGELNKEILGQLPYHVVDGCNNYGIRVSTHVLYNDFEFEGSGNNPIELLPNYILNNVKSLDNISSIRSYISSLSVPTQLKEADYLLQFLVTDGTATYYIGPSDNGYEIVNASGNPKLTNFKWVNRSVVSRTDSDLQDRPTGIERWNIIDVSDLNALRFTLAYESPNRLSEFIGDNGTTKDSTDAELMPIYNAAHNAYLRRTRNGETWQTVHSVVYGNKGIESLYVQEDFAKNYITNVDLTGYATEEWVEAQGYLTEHQDISGKADITYVDSEIDRVEGEIPTVPTNVSAFTNDAGYLTQHQDISGKQDKLTAGTNITIDSNNVISATGSDVFIAEYGVTTYSEVLNAYNDGRFVVVIFHSNADIFAVLSTINEARATFTSIEKQTNIVVPRYFYNYFSVDYNNNWTNQRNDIQTKIIVDTDSGLSLNDYGVLKIKKPSSSTGTYVMKCINGTVTWVAE